jgi:hypothetical protein
MPLLHPHRSFFRTYDAQTILTLFFVRVLTFCTTLHIYTLCLILLADNLMAPEQFKIALLLTVYASTPAYAFQPFKQFSHPRI